MEYKENITYALRVIENYNLAKGSFGGAPYNEYSLVTCALLGALSAVFPDKPKSGNSNGFLIDLNLKSPEELPKLEYVEDVESYFKNIRNGLAHKTGANFKELVESHVIVGLRISSRNGKKVSLDYNDFEKILFWIEKKIREKL